ncbi:MAG: hypothetical protein BWK75_02080 [Candidatus Altiarchaeales archaeon A3]|nr:MAG: hypothetical protein BWK75_02080 [Candidatus Altiarchaeales archaeon A3]
MALEIEFLSSNLLKEKEGHEKISFILHKIKDGKILILEEPLTSLEEAKLIEETMIGIDDKFKGIEVATLGEENKSFASKIAAMLGIRKGITVIGPATVIQKMRKEKAPQKILLTAAEDLDDKKDEPEK